MFASSLRLAVAFVLSLLASSAVAQTITVGSLTLTHCIAQYNGYCGTLIRPLDATGHVPGTLSVGFEFYPHTDTTQPPLGTILAEEGGPGYSSTGSRDGYIRLFAPLRTRRDILLVDKRGTGRSAAIDCKRLQQDRFPYQAAYRACGAQLGRRAWLYGSDQSADDLAAVMAALQTGPVDYYGDSYGTFFGQVFAARHPELLRTIVLDSAYPVLGGTPYFATEIRNGAVAMERVCARSPACRALGPSTTSRFEALLAALRASPVSGVAPGADGTPRRVSANPASLFLMIYLVGNDLVAYRDIDAAGRAWLDHGDPTPLLRLVAEAEDGAAGGGPANQFSTGLATAVMCQDYHTLFDMRAPEQERRRQFAAAIAAKTKDDPNLYAPFTLADALAAPSEPEALATCLVWPPPPPDATPGFPVPPGASFPKIPVLVLAGELDTVTSPKEAAQTTALFPQAWFVVVRNTGHETAIGDGGYFVTPHGEDFGGCVGPIVLAFVASGGNPGDTSCALRIRPVRPVAAFALSWRDVAPAAASQGNQAGTDSLRLASAAAETVGDALARYLLNTTGAGAGLRDGRFSFAPERRGYVFKLDRLRWTADAAISGTLAWNQLDGRIQADISLEAGAHSGALTITWQDRAMDAVAHMSGQIDGQHVEAERTAP
jgi:pimeloyl-ACP methyl ester carboxylesterase